MNVIMRVAWRRPEMFKLSLDYEIEAREHHMLPGDFVTIFVVDHNPDKKTFELIKQYPYKKKVLLRDKRYGLTVNILEGMKTCFNLTEDYVVYIENDILIHKTYFQYMDVLMNTVDDYSVLSAYNSNDKGDVRGVYKAHHYAALAPLINKSFHTTYIEPCSNNTYYAKLAQYVINLNEKYRDHWGKIYKYKDSTHYEQAGLLNRLIDVSAIEEDVWCYMPRVNRQQHIGYFGKNRPGGTIPGDSFEERLENLKEIIQNADKMYELSRTKQYNDYKVFSPKLNDWDGTLYVK